MWLTCLPAVKWHTPIALWGALVEATPLISCNEIADNTVRSSSPCYNIAEYYCKAEKTGSHTATTVTVTSTSKIRAKPYLAWYNLDYHNIVAIKPVALSFVCQKSISSPWQLSWATLKAFFDYPSNGGKVPRSYCEDCLWPNMEFLASVGLVQAYPKNSRLYCWHIVLYYPHATVCTFNSVTDFVD